MFGKKKIRPGDSGKKLLQPSRAFAYKLASRLGIADVDAMLQQLTEKQIEEWRQVLVTSTP